MEEEKLKKRKETWLDIREVLTKINVFYVLYMLSDKNKFKSTVYVSCIYGISAYIIFL